MTDNCTKYIAIIVGGTPEEPWDVEREYYATNMLNAAARAQIEAENHNARVTSIEEVLTFAGKSSAETGEEERVLESELADP